MVIIIRIAAQSIDAAHIIFYLDVALIIAGIINNRLDESGQACPISRWTWRPSAAHQKFGKFCYRFVPEFISRLCTFRLDSLHHLEKLSCILPLGIIHDLAGQDGKNRYCKRYYPPSSWQALSSLINNSPTMNICASP